MSYIQLTKQGTPSSANVGTLKVYPDVIDSEMKTIDENGIIRTFKSVYGNQLHYAKNNVTSTNTTTTYQTYLTLNTSSLPLGTYRLDFHYYWTHSATNGNIVTRVAENATLLGIEHVQEPSDSANTQQRPVQGFRILENISGSKTFTLDFKVGTAGQVSTLQYAEMFLIRIA